MSNRPPAQSQPRAPTVLDHLEATARLFERAPLHENAGVQAIWMREAIDCIREQQAALRLLLTEVELSGNADSTDYGWPDALKATRAVLAKWRID